MALTAVLLRANAALAGLSEEQIAAIEELSRNDENTVIGTPVVEGASVDAKVVANGKSKKIIVFKYKPKKGEKTKQGHRQPYTKVQINEIG